MAPRSRITRRIRRMKSQGSSTNSKLANLVKAGRRNGLKNFSSPVRKDKVRIAKKRVATGFYSSPQINNLIAERIIEDFRNIRNI
ncbi:MAG: hypothetical protein A2145_06315 [candidate division Zixibacteria bacterium RBG_16_40_9]|nr:MAG: hypothetical protein A2145_06315 [candidate division Zixibacteria bacterium RBG_16_40_9]